MPIPKLTTYKFRVYAGNPDDPEEFHVQGVGRDVQRVETLFVQNKWGSPTDRPMTSAAATCYFAMVRRQEFTGTFEEFEEWYLAVEPEEAVTINPIEPGPIPG